MKKFVASGKSFIKIKKSKGPKIDPWGTPYSMPMRDDLTLPSLTNCDLPDK